jgi:hypothetical protein
MKSIVHIEQSILKKKKNFSGLLLALKMLYLELA